MDTRIDRKTNRRRQMSDVAEAQGALSKTHAKQACGRSGVVAAIRSKLRKPAQRVFDAAISETPGMATVQLAVAISAVQAFEFARLAQDMKRAKSDEARQSVAAMMAESRRNGRALKSVCDSLIKAAKVAGELDLGHLPDVVRFVGAATLRTQLVSGPSSPAE